MRHLLKATLLFILMMSLSHVFAQGVTVESERILQDIVAEANVPLATVSPDSNRIAWYEQTGRNRDRVRYLCVYTFENAGKDCYTMPETYQSVPVQLQWSPDSTQIAFTESYIYQDDSDIWLFTLADGSFADLTDDGYEGYYPDAPEGTITIDYFPMWDQNTGDIYFWRSIPVSEYQYTLSLYTGSVEDAEFTEVVDLTDEIPNDYLLYDHEYFYMDGVTALSPDGSKIAMILQSLANFSITPMGLWILDLSNDNSLTNLATYDDFQTGLPEWSYFPAVPEGLSWAADSNGIVIYGSNNDFQVPINTTYYADVAAGTLTPIVDFSSSPDPESFTTEPVNGDFSLRFYSPFSTAMSPSGTEFLMYNSLAGVTGIYQVDLPPDGSLPDFIYQSDTDDLPTMTRTNTSNTDKLIMSNVLFTIAEE